MYITYLLKSIYYFLQFLQKRMSILFDNLDYLISESPSEATMSNEKLCEFTTPIIHDTVDNTMNIINSFNKIDEQVSIILQRLKPEKQ